MIFPPTNLQQDEWEQILFPFRLSWLERLWRCPTMLGAWRCRRRRWHREKCVTWPIEAGREVQE